MVRPAPLVSLALAAACLPYVAQAQRPTSPPSTAPAMFGTCDDAKDAESCLSDDRPLCDWHTTERICIGPYPRTWCALDPAADNADACNAIPTCEWTMAKGGPFDQQCRQKADGAVCGRLGVKACMIDARSGCGLDGNALRAEALCTACDSKRAAGPCEDVRGCRWAEKSGKCVRAACEGRPRDTCGAGDLEGMCMYIETHGCVEVGHGEVLECSAIYPDERFCDVGNSYGAPCSWADGECEPDEAFLMKACKDHTPLQCAFNPTCRLKQGECRDVPCVENPEPMSCAMRGCTYFPLLEACTSLEGFEKCAVANMAGGPQDIEAACNRESDCFYAENLCHARVGCAGLPEGACQNDQSCVWDPMYWSCSTRSPGTAMCNILAKGRTQCSGGECEGMSPRWLADKIVVPGAAMDGTLLFLFDTENATVADRPVCLPSQTCGPCERGYEPNVRARVVCAGDFVSFTQQVCVKSRVPPSLPMPVDPSPGPMPIAGTCDDAKDAESCLADDRPLCDWHTTERICIGPYPRTWCALDPAADNADACNAIPTCEWTMAKGGPFDQQCRQKADGAVCGRLGVKACMIDARSGCGLDGNALRAEALCTACDSKEAAGPCEDVRGCRWAEKSGKCVRAACEGRPRDTCGAGDLEGICEVVDPRGCVELGGEVLTCEEMFPDERACDIGASSGAPCVFKDGMCQLDLSALTQTCRAHTRVQCAFNPTCAFKGSMCHEVPCHHLQGFETCTARGCTFLPLTETCTSNVGFDGCVKANAAAPEDVARACAMSQECFAWEGRCYARVGCEGLPPDACERDVACVWGGQACAEARSAATPRCTVLDGRTACANGVCEGLVPRYMQKIVMNGTFEGTPLLRFDPTLSGVIEPRAPVCLPAQDCSPCVPGYEPNARSRVRCEGDAITFTQPVCVKSLAPPPVSPPPSPVNCGDIKEPGDCLEDFMRGCDWDLSTGTCIGPWPATYCIQDTDQKDPATLSNECNANPHCEWTAIPGGPFRQLCRQKPAGERCGEFGAYACMIDARAGCGIDNRASRAEEVCTACDSKRAAGPCEDVRGCRWAEKSGKCVRAACEGRPRDTCGAGDLEGICRWIAPRSCVEIGGLEALECQRVFGDKEACDGGRAAGAPCAYLDSECRPNPPALRRPCGEHTILECAFDRKCILADGVCRDQPCAEIRGADACAARGCTFLPLTETCTTQGGFESCAAANAAADAVACGMEENCLYIEGRCYPRVGCTNVPEEQCRRAAGCDWDAAAGKCTEKGAADAAACNILDVAAECQADAAECEPGLDPRWKQVVTLAVPWRTGTPLQSVNADGATVGGKIVCFPFQDCGPCLPGYEPNLSAFLQCKGDKVTWTGEVCIKAGTSTPPSSTPAPRAVPTTGAPLPFKGCTREDKSRCYGMVGINGPMKCAWKDGEAKCVETQCPVVDCQMPPSGCRYEVVDRRDTEGCLLYPCGHLVCDTAGQCSAADTRQCLEKRTTCKLVDGKPTCERGPGAGCPQPMCDAPAGCEYKAIDDPRLDRMGCPVRPCGMLVCTNVCTPEEQAGCCPRDAGIENCLQCVKEANTATCVPRPCRTAPACIPPPGCTYDTSAVQLDACPSCGRLDCPPQDLCQAKTCAPDTVCKIVRDVAVCAPKPKVCATECQGRPCLQLRDGSTKCVEADPCDTKRCADGTRCVAKDGRARCVDVDEWLCGGCAGDQECKQRFENGRLGWGCVAKEVDRDLCDLDACACSGTPCEDEEICGARRTGTESVCLIKPDSEWIEVDPCTALTCDLEKPICRIRAGGIAECVAELQKDTEPAATACDPLCDAAAEKCVSDEGTPVCVPRDTCATNARGVFDKHLRNTCVEDANCEEGFICPTFATTDVSTAVSAFCACDQVTGDVGECAAAEAVDRRRCIAAKWRCDEATLAEWSAEEKRWCCTRRQRGCDEYKCNAVGTEGPEMWSPKRREYCCTATKGLLGCRTLNAGEHDCTTRETWSFAKKKYCCEKQQVGCPVAEFDCFDEAFDPATAAKRAVEYCCRTEGVGCGVPPHNVEANLFNCDTKERFSKEKAAYCCKTEGVGCPPPRPKFDCDEEGSLETAWTEDQRFVCCMTTGRGCSADDDVYDCDFAVDQDTRTADFEKQRRWCCENTGKGCLAQKACDAASRRGTGVHEIDSATRNACCAKLGRFCEYECDSAPELQADWTAAHRRYCCARKGVGCDAGELEQAVEQARQKREERSRASLTMAFEAEWEDVLANPKSFIRKVLSTCARSLVNRTDVAPDIQISRTGPLTDAGRIPSTSTSVAVEVALEGQIIDVPDTWGVDPETGDDLGSVARHRAAGRVFAKGEVSAVARRLMASGAIEAAGGVRRDARALQAAGANLAGPGGGVFVDLVVMDESTAKAEMGAKYIKAESTSANLIGKNEGDTFPLFSAAASDPVVNAGAADNDDDDDYNYTWVAIVCAVAGVAVLAGVAFMMVSRKSNTATFGDNVTPNDQALKLTQELNPNPPQLVV